MKFKISTTAFVQTSDREVRELEALGFKIQGGIIQNNGKVFVEIKTINELMKFVNKFGKLIIHDDQLDPEIEIYNGYRE